jgi:hypothetical protein
MPASAVASAAKQVVIVIHNGEDKEFSYSKDELVGTLRELALTAFSVVNGPHLFGLFTESNEELPDDTSLHDAKVHPKERLVLRQSTVRGG